MQADRDRLAVPPEADDERIRPASSSAACAPARATLSGGGCVGVIVSVGSGPASAHDGLGASMPSVRDAAQTTRSCSFGSVKSWPGGSWNTALLRSGSTASHDDGLFATGIPTIGATIACTGSIQARRCLRRWTRSHDRQAPRMTSRPNAANRKSMVSAVFTTRP